ncbi:hypothetical protein I3843_01G076000 [Carya illinoinensis]|nr:hypothetical protein I3843_01G076000 [Carya illinoinensis]
MEMNTNFYYRALLLLFVSSMREPLHLCGADPTDGFTRVPLTEENFVLQKPYDGYDYTSGVWQFEGYAFVPKGTSGATIVQILGGAQSATTLQLRIYNGDIRYYSSKLVATDLYNKWFRVNIIHDVGNGKVRVFISGTQKYEGNDSGWEGYFKFGVYAAPAESSDYMESSWKWIKLYKK